MAQTVENVQRLLPHNYSAEDKKKICWYNNFPSFWLNLYHLFALIFLLSKKIPKI